MAATAAAAAELLKATASKAKTGTRIGIGDWDWDWVKTFKWKTRVNLYCAANPADVPLPSCLHFTTTTTASHLIFLHFLALFSNVFLCCLAIFCWCGSCSALDRAQKPKPYTSDVLCVLIFFWAGMCVCECPFFLLAKNCTKICTKMHGNSSWFVLSFFIYFFLFSFLFFAPRWRSPPVYLIQGLKPLPFFHSTHLYITLVWRFVCSALSPPTRLASSQEAWRTKSETFKRVLLKVTYCTRPWLICRLLLTTKDAEQEQKL